MWSGLLKKVTNTIKQGLGEEVEDERILMRHLQFQDREEVGKENQESSKEPGESGVSLAQKGSKISSAYEETKDVTFKQYLENESQRMGSSSEHIMQAFSAHQDQRNRMVKHVSSLKEEVRSILASLPH